MSILRNLGTSVLTSTFAAALSAQTPRTAGDTVLAAGPHYRAGGLHRLLLGKEYRPLWTTPIAVPLLDLDTLGGLRVVSKGGGLQTKSLLLRANDGREFFFRSVDKDPSALLPPELRPTVAGQVVRDQTSSALPTAPPVVDRLLSAVEIPHDRARLFVLPRDSRLGEFQAEFAGLMGYLEERIGAPAGPSARWGGATEIIGSDSLFARTGRSPDDRVDARAFLTARLFDLVIGDWDRHADQWAWGRFGDGVPRVWKPIPRDRDQAFAKYDGLLLSIARTSAPQLTDFGASYPYITGATWNGRDLDRRFLVELEWPEWKATAASLQAKLTDAAIDEAVRNLPPEHYAIQGKALASALRKRRDQLPEAARRYYRLLAAEVDVTATAGSDDARFTRNPNGDVELTLSWSGAAAGNAAYFRRRFQPGTTKEIRLFLGNGNDHAVTAGDGSGGPRLRILGESGADRLVDSSRKGRDKFYDDPAAPARTEGLAADVDRRPYRPPPRGEGELPPRDWGSRWVPAIWAAFAPDVGLFFGGGPILTTYGFRKHPYASWHRLRAGFATGPKSYRVDYLGDFRRENSAIHFELLGRASGIDVINFHGFGNEISAPQDKEFYRVTQDAFRVQPSVVFGFGENTSLQVGPQLRYASTDNRPGRFLATLDTVYGADNFGQVGGSITLRHDSRDRVTAATRGLAFELGGDFYPAIWDVDSTYGAVHAEAKTYFTARAPLSPTLALRAGGRKLWGQYPFFDAAFIGGASTVRLGRVNRYGGDASAYGSAELRLALLRFNLVLPAQLGIFGLADAGRVFLEGESSDQWHTAFGGGVSLSYLDRAYTFSLAVASGDERTGVYLQAGYGF